MAVDPGVELDALGIREVLDQDSRPTFVLDLDPDEDKHNSLNSILPVFCNSALRLHERLLDSVTGKVTDESATPPDQPSKILRIGPRE